MQRCALCVGLLVVLASGCATIEGEHYYAKCRNAHTLCMEYCAVHVCKDQADADCVRCKKRCSADADACDAEEAKREGIPLPKDRK